MLGVDPTGPERAARRPGDELVCPADVVMDRAFTVPAPPAAVWPWLVQLGKRRAGWYLPRPVERLVPPGRRAARRIEERWQGLAVGDVIPDYGGRDETFTVALLEPGRYVVYTSRRGSVRLTWSISVTGQDDASTRVRLRLRMSPVRRKWLANSAGELLDLLTIAGMAAGLRERVSDRSAVGGESAT